ncbi:Uma2 family endonuclease [Haliscomenobacter sp.]|uniref:Uma2 family endonuclease n=1 Tax=Haliscomenobacter sp. TaxID=2717303 RepID=UPI0033650CE5
MAVQAQRKLFTVDDYYKMAEVGILAPEDRVELIHGEIIKMSPIKSFHSSMVDHLHEMLLLLLHGKAIIKGQNPIRIDDYSEPEPDLTIAKFQAHKYRHQHPRPEDVHFLIEVADTTLQKDRKIKLPLYAEAGIPEVWIVNLKNNSVEVYTNPLDGAYQELNTLKVGEVLHFESLGLELELERVFG